MDKIHLFFVVFVCVRCQEQKCVMLAKQILIPLFGFEQMEFHSDADGFELFVWVNCCRFSLAPTLDSAG